jgi:hypothetical protein
MGIAFPASLGTTGGISHTYYTVCKYSNIFVQDSPLTLSQYIARLIGIGLMVGVIHTLLPLVVTISTSW